LLLPNDLDGTSAISFFFPSMCDVINGHALFAFILNAKACTNCSATMDCFDASLLIQLIDGVLSPNNAIVFSVKSPPTPSITSHAITIPAISRSEFVILPPGFSAEFTSRVISIAIGHCHLNNVGTQLEFSPKTTPPTP
jgi:hypothetical protein